MSEPASISSGIAARYATAMFELALEGKALKDLESDIDALEGALAESPELRDVIASPVYSRADLSRAIAELAKAMKLSSTTAGVLGLMAGKRRLFVLPQMLVALRERIAEEKGEVTADVVAARKLTKAQSDALVKTLKSRIGKDVKLNVAVDETLIGGLVVKVGSKMIDTSIRSRLTALQNAMKEVG